MERPQEVNWFLQQAPTLANVWGPEVAAYIEQLERERDAYRDTIEYVWDFSASPRLIERRIMEAFPDITQRE